MLLSEFVKDKRIIENLPFDPKVEPEAWDGPFKQIGRFHFPVYKDLLVRESWLFELIRDSQGKRSLEFQIALLNLAKILKEEFGLKSDTEATKMLSSIGAAEEAPENETEEQKTEREKLFDKKQDFLIRHLDKFNLLNDLGKASQGGAIEAWIRITFFINSRCDASWSFGKTASLRKSEIDGILAFIAEETAGGEVPQQETEQDLGNVSVNSEKQPMPEVQNGTVSTGSLALAGSATSA